MPLINYSVLDGLLEEFDALMSPPGAEPERQRRLEDVQYTMCVYTGVRDPHEAAAQARRLLRRHVEAETASPSGAGATQGS